MLSRVSIRTLILAGLLLWGCRPSHVSKPSPASAPGAPPYVFAWPASAQAHVQVEIERSATSSYAAPQQSNVKLRYTLVVAPAPNPDQQIVSFQDVSVDSFQGETLLFLPLLPTVQPDLLISKDGKLLDILNVDEKLKAFLQSHPQPANPSAQTLIGDPKAKALFFEERRGLWNLWVSMWTIFEAPPGKSVTVQRSASTSQGAIVQIPLVFTHKGQGQDGRVKLEASYLQEGSLQKELLVELLKDLDPALNTDELRSIRRRTTYSVELDPKTLLPAYAREEIETEVRGQGDSYKRSHNTQEYRFQWSQKN